MVVDRSGTLLTMRDLTELERGWIAGMLEGEGYFALEISRAGYATSRITINTTDGDVAERFVEVTGLGRICLPATRPEHKQVYRWQVNKRGDVEDLIRAVLPLLGERRTEQALKVLNRTC